jgi:putative membrane protein
MADFLNGAYLWVKALHVIAVVAWMAGLFYLPRLFVYHAEQVEAGSKTEAMFLTMERRLLRAIMAPASVAVWLFGLMLVATPGIVDWGQVWPWSKAAAVIAMTLYHHWLARRWKDFAAGRNRLSGRQYRLMNEVPTLLLIVIVLSVIVKF